MASEAELLALAERLEQSGGPDRSIDYAIGYLEGEHNQPPEMWQYIMPKSKIDNRCPRYTASLGAAIALVPQGWWWSVGDCSVSADASCGPDVAYCSKDLLVRFDAGIHVELDQPAAPASALCVVALRARAVTMGGSDD